MFNIFLLTALSVAVGVFVADWVTKLVSQRSKRNNRR